MKKYIFYKILAIIILLFVALAAAGFFLHLPREYEQEFRGTFVRKLHGNLYQAQEESGFIKSA